MDAAEARRWGLVHDIVEPSDLADRALRLAEDIARSSPLAVRAVLEAARSKADDSLDDALTSRFESVEAYLGQFRRQQGGASGDPGEEASAMAGPLGWRVSAGAMRGWPTFLGANTYKYPSKRIEPKLAY